MRAPGTLRRRKYRRVEGLSAERGARVEAAAGPSQGQTARSGEAQPAQRAESEHSGSCCRALTRLDPLSPDRDLPGWQPPEPGMRPLWPRCNGLTEPVEAYLTTAGLERLLDGSVPEPADLIDPDNLFGLDRRSGIAIDPESLTAQESQLYSASFLTLRPGVAMYAELDLTKDSPQELFAEPTTIRFGGEGRRAKVRRVEPICWPDRRAELTAADPPARCLILLTTPAILARRWRARLRSGVQLGLDTRRPVRPSSYWLKSRRQ